MIDDRKLYPGDYNRAEGGSVDRRVWSETGCTCVLLTSYDNSCCAFVIVPSEGRSAVLCQVPPGDA